MSPPALYQARTDAMVSTAAHGDGPDVYMIDGGPLAPSPETMHEQHVADREASAILRRATESVVAASRYVAQHGGKWWTAARAEEIRREASAKAAEVRRRAETDFVPMYLADLEEGYEAHRDAWGTLLMRPRVVLVSRCAQTRIMLAHVLAALGATVTWEAGYGPEHRSHPAARR